MPTININKKIFLKSVGRYMKDEFIEEKISMMGVSVEEIKKEEIIVEVFPNRPDLLSEYGLARAASSFLGITKGIKNYKVNKSKYIINVEKTTNDWPYAVTAVVKGLKLNDQKIKEIIQMQEKLGTTFLRNRKKGGIGLYPLEKIKFPVTFTSEIPEKIEYRPLEYPKEISAREILEKHPTGKEYKHIIHNWKKFPIFKDSEGRIMSMPPIVNSHSMGKITEDTRDIFIEATGTDFQTISTAINIIVTSLSDMGGRIYSTKLIYGKNIFYTPNLNPGIMKIDFEYVNKRLGLELKSYEINKMLEKMGYGIKKKGKEFFVFIPAYRSDVIHQIDLAEDIAIAYGYDHLKEEIPNVSTIAQENKFEIFRRKVSEIFIGLGLMEVHTSNIINKDVQTTNMNINLKYVELANSLSEEYNTLRHWILPGFIQILKENKHNEYPHNIFGSGCVFKYDQNKETGLSESINMAVVLCHSSANFTQAKQIFDVLIKSLDLKYTITELEDNSFISGRYGKIIIRNVEVGFIGEIHPKVLENFHLEMPVSTFEINLEELYRLI